MTSGINNRITDLFDLLIESEYEGLVLKDRYVPRFWETIYETNIPGYQELDLDELRYDLEAIGIIPKPGKDMGYIYYDYEQEDGTKTKLKIRYSQYLKHLKLRITQLPEKLRGG